MKYKIKQQEKKWGQKNYKTENDKTAINSPPSIITLNVNGLKSLIKRYRLAE